MQTPGSKRRAASISQRSYASHGDVIEVLSDVGTTAEVAADAIVAWIKVKQGKGRTIEYICAKLEAMEAKFISMPSVHIAFQHARGMTGLPSSFTLPNVSPSPFRSPAFSVPTPAPHAHSTSPFLPPPYIPTAAPFNRPALPRNRTNGRPSTSAGRPTPSPLHLPQEATAPSRGRPQSVHGDASPKTSIYPRAAPVRAVREEPSHPSATNTRSHSHTVSRSAPKDYAAALASLQASYGGASGGVPGGAPGVMNMRVPDVPRSKPKPPLSTKSSSATLARPKRGRPQTPNTSAAASTFSSVGSTSSTSFHTSPDHGPSSFLERVPTRPSFDMPWETLRRTTSLPAAEERKRPRPVTVRADGELVDGLLSEESAHTFLRLFKA